MKKHDRLPDFSKLCAPEQTPISFFLSQQIYFFFLGSIGGFLWEVAIFLYRDKTFANRGFFYGPWLPVYGIGAVLFYLLLGCRRKKIHPAGVFFLSAAIGTGLELLIGWFLDAFWNLRYWDYSGYPFHFHGYICLYAAVGFGIAGVLWICVLEAPLTRLWKRLSPKVRLGLNTLLLLLFAADCAAALIFPNRGAGHYLSLKIALHLRPKFCELRVCHSVAALKMQQFSK